MNRTILLAALALATPVAAQAQSTPPATTAPQGEAKPLSLEHRMLLRCSAAFALIAHRQTTGDEEALAFPPLQQRGQEFFVQASARVIDEAGLDRDGVAAALTAEALELTQGEALQQVMPACLSVLEGSGL